MAAAARHAHVGDDRVNRLRLELGQGFPAVTGFHHLVALLGEILSELVSDLGLVVDDTIHILQGFRRECAATGNVEEATARTMQARGRAILFTTVVLISAFSSYDFTSADTVSNLGWLTALAVLLTFLFDIFLSRALLVLVYRKR